MALCSTCGCCSVVWLKLVVEEAAEEHYKEENENVNGRKTNVNGWTFLNFVIASLLPRVKIKG